MPEFETLESTKIPFKNGLEFIELSVNIMRDGAKEVRYIRLQRGYVDKEGKDRYKKGGLTLPRDRDALNQLSDALKAFDLNKVTGEAD